jgi:ABC-2 type transport system permease protein
VTAVEVRGPSALGQDRGRFLSLVRTLTLTEFKLKFYGSVLGYVWQLLRPLMLFGILYVVFTEFVKFGADVKHYPVVLLLGILLYSFVAESISQAVESVVAREPLVRKVDFPRLVIPMSVVATALLNLMLNMVVVVVFAVASGVELTWRWIELPLLVGAAAFLAAGAAALASALYVRYRDVKPISDVLLQVLFYATPIFYPIEHVADHTVRKLLLLLNPFAVIVQQARHAIVDPSAPSPHTVVGSWALLAIPAAITVAVVATGFWYFNREAPRIAEDL